jgi:hypothetical protein
LYQETKLLDFLQIINTQMKNLHIITPVKDSIDSTLQTIKAVLASKCSLPITYTIYNDNSTPENTALLKRYSEELGFELVNIADITDHPSPNYLLVLQMAQQRAIENQAGLLIVESDVIVEPHTADELVKGALERTDCGIAASVTVDDQGKINYPYQYAIGTEGTVYAVSKHCSFCCSLLTPALLKSFDFKTLDADKHWFDVHISHASLECGLKNYLFCTLPVIHRPHSSRPWKQLKYSNPLKYYFLKYICRKFDKI